MFATAQKVKTAKAPKKAEKATVPMDSLAQYAALDAVIKALEGMKKVMEADVKGQAQVEFVTKGFAAKKRPENFKGTETFSFEAEEGEDALTLDASASVELRARSSSSAVTETELPLLQAAGIPVEEVVSVVGTYVINPEYLNDAEIMGKAEAALVAAGLPADLIQQQDEVKKTVVSSTALEHLFGNYDEQTIQQFLPMVGVIALKPKLGTEDISDAFKVVSQLLASE